MKVLILYILPSLLFVSASAQTTGPGNDALRTLLKDTLLKNAHVGISIYDPLAKKQVFDYNGDKYFVPASNVKIITTYASLKYLKHLLTGLRYYENDTAVYILPTGDPTLLHRDFPKQPVIDFLKAQRKKIYLVDHHWQDRELGKGWSWDDFSDEYMTERNLLPVYGNVLRWVQEKVAGSDTDPEQSMSVYSDPEVNWKVGFEPNPEEPKFQVKRDRLNNVFTISEGPEDKKELYVPFITNGTSTAVELLADTVHKNITINNNFVVTDPQKKSIGTQPLDSVLRPMMYRSDNFMAEQLLLMVSEEKFGVLDVEMLIDSILNTDLAWLPQKPVWVDGSGLSRYNLFSPRDFVVLLDSMRIQFGIERLKTIFPTGDSGTLRGYFKGEPRPTGKARSTNVVLYAKTGSMSGVTALSGYMYTRSKRLLVFSIIVNNFNGKVTPVRRAVERFLNREW